MKFIPFFFPSLCAKKFPIYFFLRMLAIRKYFCKKLSHLKQYYAKAITERVPRSEGVNYSIDKTVVQLDESRSTLSLMMEQMCFHQLIINCL